MDVVLSTVYDRHYIIQTAEMSLWHYSDACWADIVRRLATVSVSLAKWYTCIFMYILLNIYKWISLPKTSGWLKDMDSRLNGVGIFEAYLHAKFLSAWHWIGSITIDVINSIRNLINSIGSEGWTSSVLTAGAHPSRGVWPRGVWGHL